MNPNIEIVEEPMNMNYRESVAWQKGYDKGWKQAKEYFNHSRQDKSSEVASNLNEKARKMSFNVTDNEDKTADTNINEVRE